MKKYQTFRIADAVKHSRLQFLLTTTYTIITAVALLTFGLSLYFRYTSQLASRVGEDSVRLINQVNHSLDSYLRGLMRVSDTMYYTVVKNADLDRDSIAADINLLYEANHDQIISIALFDQEGHVLASVPQSTPKGSADPAGQDWFQAALRRIENFHFSPPHVQNLFDAPDSSYQWVISLSRAVELTHSGQTTQGVLLVDMGFGGVEQICKSNNWDASGYLYLLDEQGEILYHPYQQLINAGLRQENNRTAAGYEEGNHTETFLGEKRLVTVKSVSYTGWKLVGVTPLRDIESGILPNQPFLLFLLLLVITLIALVNMILSSRITVPLRKLEGSVSRLEAGELDTPVYVGGSYEVSRLGEAIRAMVAQMRRLMDDIVREQEAKRRGELEVLQAQINPHFLYNTLDSIVWMIENERYGEAIRMVTALARLFRISLSKGRNVISLGTELQHAKSYLTIQEMRYKNKFAVEMDCDRTLERYSCLKLVIQPLLENAIYHGMEYMDGDGRITIRTRLQNGELHIEVQDNGLGIPPAVLETLLTEEHGRHLHPADGRERKGYGLRNVHERIRLTYGAPYGLEIESEPDCGTLVRIRLPAKPFQAGQKGDDA